MVVGGEDMKFEWFRLELLYLGSIIRRGKKYPFTDHQIQHLDGFSLLRRTSTTTFHQNCACCHGVLHKAFVVR